MKTATLDTYIEPTLAAQVVYCRFCRSTNCRCSTRYDVTPAGRTEATIDSIIALIDPSNALGARRA